MFVFIHQSFTMPNIRSQVGRYRWSSIKLLRGTSSHLCEPSPDCADVMTTTFGPIEIRYLKTPSNLKIPSYLKILSYLPYLR